MRGVAPRHDTYTRHRRCKRRDARGRAGRPRRAAAPRRQKQMPFVPESVLKKRRAQAAIAADKDTASKAAAAEAKGVIFKRGEVRRRVQAAGERCYSARREAKRRTPSVLRRKLAFVIRIGCLIGMSPKVKKILQLLRLRQLPRRLRR